MTFVKSTLMIMLSILVIGACSQKTKNDMNEAGQKTGDAIASMGDDMQQSKDQFVASVNKQLNTVDAQIDELKGKINEQSGEAKSELQDQWKELNKKKEVLKKKLNKAGQNTQDNWLAFKNEVSSQMDSLKTSIKKIKSELGGDGKA